ncbi:MAG: GNAT family N-acetyltransferase, partial [Ruminiclostridium sp.]|nr:GNAT family N-acetyltransferase [Ruminiclostridium sp.]
AVSAYALFRIIEVNGEEKVSRKVCFIDCFGVDENKRHKGIGKRLFEGVKEYAQKMGCNAVQLGVDAENENARGFYEKVGLLPRTIIMAQNI